MIDHLMKLTPEPMRLIREGKKTIELRLYDEKRKKIQIGDTITFVNTDNENDKLTVKVEDLFRFDSFEELYDKLPLSECGYTEENIGSASPEDMNIYYSVELQKQYGVVGIKIKPLRTAFNWKIVAPEIRSDDEGKPHPAVRHENIRLSDIYRREEEQRRTEYAHHWAVSTCWMSGGAIVAVVMVLADRIINSEVFSYLTCFTALLLVGIGVVYGFVNGVYRCPHCGTLLYKYHPANCSKCGKRIW